MKYKCRFNKESEGRLVILTLEADNLNDLDPWEAFREKYPNEADTEWDLETPILTA